MWPHWGRLDDEQLMSKVEEIEARAHDLERRVLEVEQDRARVLRRLDIQVDLQRRPGTERRSPPGRVEM